MGASGGPWATDPKIASALHFIPQGISADLIATKYGYTRSRCDEVALRSQALAAQAVREGRFERSLIAVTDANGLDVLAADEHPLDPPPRQTISPPCDRVSPSSGSSMALMTWRAPALPRG